MPAFVRYLFACLAGVALALVLSMAAAAGDTHTVPPPPPPSTDPVVLAEECLENALDLGALYMYMPPNERITGAHSLRFQAYSHDVETNERQYGPSCNLYGSRTDQVWMVMADNRGKVHRNSPRLAAIKNSNAALESTWFTLPVWKPYACKPGRGRRFWGLVIRDTAHYGGRTKVEQQTLDATLLMHVPC